MHNDDISNVLILNKKSIPNHENQLFQAELEKFRPHQTRLLQAQHKQSSLLKELTKAYGDLLQDKRVRSEQSKYETISRQRNSVMTRYRKVFNAFNDLTAGLMRAQGFYTEMRDTLESLEKNVEAFVNNRRSEGAQLLNQIEQDKASGAGGQADRERERLRELMERMSTEPNASGSPLKSKPPPISTGPQGAKSSPTSPHYNQSSTAQPYNMPPSRSPSIPHPTTQQQYSNSTPYDRNKTPYLHPQGAVAPVTEGYNPMAYPYQTPVSPPPGQQFFPSSIPGSYGYHPQQPQQQHHQYSQQQTTQHQYMPQGHASQGYIPPPPPPGPPPGSQTQYPSSSASPYPAGPGGYAQSRPFGGLPQQQHQGHQGQQQGQVQGDPWSGLNAWK